MKNTKDLSKSMSNKENRRRLLSRASTATLAAAAAAFSAPTDAQAIGCTVPAPTLNNLTISSPELCVDLGSSVPNDINVNADIGNSGAFTAFDIGSVNVGGDFINNADIIGGSGAGLLVYDSTLSGGITNFGVIESTDNSAILLRSSSTVERIINDGTIQGNVGIDGAEGIALPDGIWNQADALISGGEIGIYLFDYMGSPTVGGIFNEGTIEGGDYAINLYIEQVDGSIVNEDEGVIRSTGYGGEGGEGYNVAIMLGHPNATVYGGLTNHGTVQGEDGGYTFLGDEYYGDIVNDGLIEATGGYGAIQLGSSATSSGHYLTNRVRSDFSNSGLIDGGDGYGVNIQSEYFDGPEGWAEVRNSGDILGGMRIRNFAGDYFFRNESRGVISNSHGIGADLSSIRLNAEIDNLGRIFGSTVGLSVGSDPLFEGKYYGCGGSEVVTACSHTSVNVIPSEFAGTITNRGTIEGDSTGALINAAAFYGSIQNFGTIKATDELEEVSISVESSTAGLVINPVQVTCSYTCGVHTAFYGSVDNSGLIQGGDGAVINLNDFAAEDVAFSNSGTIIGTTDDGLSISVDAWYGSIHNSGSIHGADAGVEAYAESFYGDFINDGHISGGELTTGVHLSGTTFSGDFVNNDLIDAPGNALHLEYDLIEGDVENHGTILATNANGTAMLLQGYYVPGYIDGAVLNTGVIEGGTTGTGIKFDNAYAGSLVNSGGTIYGGNFVVGGAAIDASNASGAMWMFNQDGGHIQGDVLLNEYYGDTLYALDGGITGYIFGDTGGEGSYDDSVRVDGVHYFIGGAERLSEFEVQDEGVAVLGTSAMGASDGAFDTANIDQTIVRSGGQLYVSDDVYVETNSFTQESDGETTFFLTSDTSLHGQIRNPGTSQAANLDGTISVDLDLASFAGDPNTEYTYEDVIFAGKLNGNFNNSSVIGGSGFFELDVIYDYDSGADGEDSVDLLLRRNSFDSLSCSDSTENNERLGAMLEEAFRNGDLTAEQLELYLAIINSSDGCSAAEIYDDLSGTPFDFLVFQLDGPFKKMVGARIDGGRSTGCVVAGSSDCFNRYAADTTAGSTVMTDATPGEDPFAWLKTGVRQTGTTAVWGRGVGVWGDTDGDGGIGAPGSRYNQKGAIVGVDHVFDETFVAGVAGQYTDTDVKFPGHVDRVHVGSYEAGAYMSWGDTQGYLNSNLSYIWHNFDTSRLVLGSPTKGQFDGDTVSAYLEAGKIYESDGWRLQPIAALSFMSLSTEGYTENGASPSRLVVKDSGFDSLKSILGGRFAYPVELNSGRRMVPEVRVSWAHEFLDNSAEFEARLFSFPDIPGSYFTTQGAEYDRDAVILGSGLNAPVGDKIILYLDYDATLSSDQTQQTASGGFRVQW